jgi:hypothetical protein
MRRDSKPGFPKYEPEVAAITQQRLVHCNNERTEDYEMSIRTETKAIGLG